MNTRPGDQLFLLSECRGDEEIPSPRPTLHLQSPLTLFHPIQEQVSSLCAEYSLALPLSKRRKLHPNCRVGRL